MPASSGQDPKQECMREYNGEKGLKLKPKQEKVLNYSVNVEIIWHDVSRKKLKITIIMQST